LGEICIKFAFMALQSKPIETNGVDFKNFSDKEEKKLWKVLKDSRQLTTFHDWTVIVSGMWDKFI